MKMPKREPKKVPTQDDSTKEEKAEQALKFHTASGRFGKVGKRSETWKK